MKGGLLIAGAVIAGFLLGAAARFHVEIAAMTARELWK